MSLLLHFGLRAKFETKSTALHWVIKLWPRHASICGKHGDRFFRTAQLNLYLQMVLLGRNVTFDLVSLTERASQRNVREGFSGLPCRTNEHMTVCMAKIGLTQFKN